MSLFAQHNPLRLPAPGFGSSRPSASTSAVAVLPSEHLAASRFLGTDCSMPILRIDSKTSEIDIVAIALMFIPFPYLFIGLQSLIAGLIMEFVNRKYAKQISHIIASGALLGVLAATTVFQVRSLNMLFGLLIGITFGFVLSLSFEEEKPTAS